MKRRFEVYHWIAPPTAMTLAPSVLLKAGWLGIRERLGC